MYGAEPEIENNKKENTLKTKAGYHHHHHHRIFVVRRLHENQNSGALHGHLTVQKDLTTKSSIKKVRQKNGKQSRVCFVSPEGERRGLG